MKVGAVEVSQAGIRTWVNEHRPTSMAGAGLFLAIVSLFSPWYAIDYIVGGSRVVLAEFGLTTVTGRFPEGYWMVMPYDSTACGCITVGGAFSTSFGLAALGILILSAVFAAKLKGMRLRPDMERGVVALAGLLVLLAPIALAVSLPGAFGTDGMMGSGLSPGGGDPGVSKQFMGSNTTSIGSTPRLVTWGPSWGWLLALVGGALMLLSSQLPRGPAKATAATAPAPAWAPAQAPAAPPSSAPTMPAPFAGAPPAAPPGA